MNLELIVVKKIENSVYSDADKITAYRLGETKHLFQWPTKIVSAANIQSKFCFLWYLCCKIKVVLIDLSVFI